MSESRSDGAAAETTELTNGGKIADNPNLAPKGGYMEWISIEDKKTPGDWRVEAIDHEHEGAVYVTIFSGPDAKERAKEYAGIKNAQEARLYQVA